MTVHVHVEFTLWGCIKVDWIWRKLRIKYFWRMLNLECNNTKGVLIQFFLMIV
jgi:hypothetical protein